MIEVRDVVGEGLLKDWLEWGAPYESADSFLLFSLLTAASAAIDGKVVVNATGEPCVKPNIYALLYGPSGSRKSSAIIKAMAVLAAAAPDTPVLPRMFSMEAAFSHLATESKEHGRCGGLMMAHEFSTVVGGNDYVKQNLQLLSDLWDCPPVYTRITHAHGPEEILEPYISCLAASAPDWLEGVDPRMLSGGALRRILLVYEFRAKHRNSSPRNDPELFHSVTERFAERVGPGLSGGIYMELDEDAKRVKRDWYDRFVAHAQAHSDDRVGHFASCLEAHALKVASVVHLLEGRLPGVLSGESLACGQHLVERILPNLTFAYNSLVPTPYARLRACIVRTLQSHPDGLKPRELDKMVVQASGARHQEVIAAREYLIHDEILRRREGGAISVS